MKVVLLVVFFLGVVNCSLPECPAEITGDVIQFPNPDDCSTFYKCLVDTPILMDCWPGLWYNPEVQVCDFPANIPEGTCKPPAE